MPQAAPMTAQEAYKALLKEHVAPALRDLGFKGSGREFELPSDTHWIQVGLQASTYSSADAVKFTVNLSAVRRDVWQRASSEQQWLGKKPKANTVSGVQGFQRIGKAMPQQQDHWWTLQPSDNLTVLSAEVVGAIRDFGIPALLSRVEATSEPLSQEDPKARWS